ncbi:MAG: hypothetical protein AAF609_25820 [Cyanobacteria bacterium P01_C01_bin.120]
MGDELLELIQRLDALGTQLSSTLTEATAISQHLKDRLCSGTDLDVDDVRRYAFNRATLLVD